MNIQDAIHRFYHNMSLNELCMMNQDPAYPNITYNSLLYLDLIYYQENCTASHLAKILHISKSAVTVKLNELIRQGFVDKRRSPEDKRVYYLSVSPAMEKVYRRYDKRLQIAMKQIREQYSREQIACFCGILEVLDRCYTEETTHEQTVETI